MSGETAGRTCPLSYRTRPEDLRGPPDVTAETVYVIGGLYGNEQALAAIESRAEQETQQGLPEPVRVFNGDFNWFNATPESMARLNERVLRHVAIQGNVEAELARPDPAVGCGCAYPAWVDDGTVGRSNQIIERLQSALAGDDGLRQALAALPHQLRVRVGDCRVGVIHGDPESLAGWGLAFERMPEPGVGDPCIEAWFQHSETDILACTHTCLPFMQDFLCERRRRLVVNNGAAGMPNFRGSADGLLTRISTHPPLAGMSLYGTRMGDLYVDALTIAAVTTEWLARFEAMWPPGSPAHRSYFERLTGGPAHSVEQAWRVRGP